MGRKWSAAVQEIKSPELERWIRRSLSDDRRAAAVSAATQAVIGVSGGVAGLEDRLLTRVLIALDHQAPLRYKQIAVRSEEHTSELQSLMRISYAVFCLKNKNSTSVSRLTYEHNTQH